MTDLELIMELRDNRRRLVDELNVSRDKLAEALKTSPSEQLLDVYETFTALVETTSSERDQFRNYSFLQDLARNELLRRLGGADAAS